MIDRWNAFVNILGEYQLDPVEKDDDTDPRKNKVEYNFKDGRKSITYGRFQNALTSSRKKKSR